VTADNNKELHDFVTWVESESADLDETEKALLNFTGHFSKAPSKKRRRDIIVIDD